VGAVLNAVVWWVMRRLGSEEARRREAARQVARVMRGYAVPGIPPFTTLQRITILVLALFLALTLFGMAALILPPAHP
jgi:hypothetical protein